MIRSMDDLMTASDSGAYRVLARKYRPTTFADLKGQEALVRTLSNAFAQGRVAHAFILTGVRGVGKTTTARIVAKGLNCLSADGPTVDPCGTCANCLAITEDRHVDVIEMDAASRTGVDDIREIIEGVRYKPVSARFKVYIIDEVHMLSRNAFNALLKTLEEPPPHVKFVFATTEIRKVPITVQSRCQRFDLRRLSAPDLIDLLGAVAATEEVTVEDEALALIARAADGSARDGLSILDQAIAMAHEAVGADQVRTMLGLADRAQIYDLFEAVMAGRLAESLELLAAMHAHGADPLVVLQDLLALTHWVTKAKTAPSALTEPGISELERTRGAAFAEALSVAVLGRTWQMLLKGVGEVQIAPQPMAACEMVLIRLAHVADLPSPGDLVKQLTENAPPAAPAIAPPSSSGGSSAAPPGALGRRPPKPRAPPKPRRRQKAPARRPLSIRCPPNQPPGIRHPASRRWRQRCRRRPASRAISTISSPCAAPIARPVCWLISAITCGRWRWPRDSSRLRSCLARRPIWRPIWPPPCGSGPAPFGRLTWPSAEGRPAVRRVKRRARRPRPRRRATPPCRRS